ncbi:MAG: hypothetical protein FJ004_06855 [Chloroflexi bacterium]|nr:hypothetical protein [Chloroflexota bacterium]
MGSPGYLLYEDDPKVDSWMKLMFAGIVLLFLIMGLVLLFEDTEAAFPMFGVAAFDAVLFRIVLPRRYQIYSDRIRIVLGGPFALNIPLSTVKEVKAASGAKAFAYSGVRFATSSKNVIEITRTRGCNYVISPSNRDVFLEQANRALEAKSHSR